MQLTAADQLHTAVIGGVTFTAQRTIEAGVTITVWNGPSRHNTTSWSYLDPALARRRWQTVAHLAATGMSAGQVADTLNADATHALRQVADLLRDAHERATADGCHGLARAVSTTLDEVESDAERAQLDKLAADIARTVDEAHGQCAADEPELEPADDNWQPCPVCGGPVRKATRNDGYGHKNRTDAERHMKLASEGRPLSLAALRAAYALTHPAVPTLAEARTRRARRASLAYDKAKARAGR